MGRHPPAPIGRRAAKASLRIVGIHIVTHLGAGAMATPTVVCDIAHVIADIGETDADIQYWYHSEPCDGGVMKCADQDGNDMIDYLDTGIEFARKQIANYERMVSELKVGKSQINGS